MQCHYYIITKIQCVWEEGGGSCQLKGILILNYRKQNKDMHVSCQAEDDGTKRNKQNKTTQSYQMDVWCTKCAGGRMIAY